MHFKSDSLINYIATKFLLRGLIASDEDIARVFNYEEEYYQDNPELEEVEVILTHQDDIVNYIRSQNPEFTRV